MKKYGRKIDLFDIVLFSYQVTGNLVNMSVIIATQTSEEISFLGIQYCTVHV